MFTRKDEKYDFTKGTCISIILASILTVTLLCFSNGISGNDFWWHIKVGEWIVEHEEVPTTDIFSWYGMEKGISWIAHEWLSEVIFYGIHSAFGSIGIFLFCITAALLMLLLMFGQARKNLERNFLLGGLFLVLFSVVASLFFYGRPHIFSYFLLFFELKILYEFVENHDSKKIYFIPVLAILWSNLHGGSSSLAYILCLIFIFSGVFNFNCDRLVFERFDKKSMIRLAIVTLGAVLGVLLNPIGIRVLAYPFINLSDNLSMSVISEWQAPDAKAIGNLILYYFPILIMTVGIMCTKKTVRAIDFLVMLAFIFLFFRSARFIVLWYIAAVFYAFRYMPEIKIKTITKRAEKAAVLSFVVVLLVPCAIGVIDMVETYREERLISKTISDEAMKVIMDDDPQRIYNDYNLGEALIYYDIPVFFDARADLYTQENIMVDGISLMYLEPAGEHNHSSYVDVDAMLEKYNFDAMLILKGRSLYSYIMNHPERFLLIYEDASLGYFRVLGGQDAE